MVPRQILSRVVPSGIPVLFLAANVILMPAYTGDDSFIHFTYARNLLETGVFAYNSAVPTYGSTSPLWVIAGWMVSLPTGAVPETMRMLGGICFVAGCLLVLRYLRREGVDGFLATASAAILLAANAVVFRWALTGMETGMVLLILALYLLVSRNPILTAVVGLFAYLVRPELALLPAAHLVVHGFRGKKARAAALAGFLLSAALLAGWCLGAYSYFGTAFPLTSIKARGALDLPTLWKIATVVAGMVPDLLVAGLIIGWIVVRSKVAPLAPEVRVLLVLSLGLIVFYLVTGTNVISRYLLPVHLALLLLVVTGVAALGRPRLFVPLVVFVACVQGVLFFGLHYPHIRAFTGPDGFQEVYGKLGRLAARHDALDTASVLVADVGLVGYYSRRPVIDPSGLVSTHIYRSGTTDPAVLALTYRPRYLILRSESEAPALDRLQAVPEESLRMRVIARISMAPLGVLAGRGSSWTVWFVELLWAGGKPTASTGHDRCGPAAAEGAGVNAQSGRTASPCACSSSWLWTCSMVSARASRNFSKSSL